MLLTQQYMTRVFSILHNAGFAFLAISITFLGLGAAGVSAAVRPGAFSPERLERLIPRLALAYSAALPASVVLLLVIDARMRGGGAAGLSDQIERILVSSLILLPAMFLVGLVLSLSFRRHVKRVDRLYGADLLGGGLGCLLILPLLEHVGGDDGIFLIGALAALGAAGLAVAHRRATESVLGVGLGVLLLFGPAANRDRALVDIRTHVSPLGGVERWVLLDQEIHRDWNALSRIGIFETQSKTCLYVQIDSNCQTTIPAQRPDYFETLARVATFEHLPYALGPCESYLEIGAGGGRGMMLALSKGVDEITGVEINPGIVAASMEGFPGYGIGPVIEGSAHRYVNDEGRSFVRNSPERYDALTITFIQTSVASASAAFALAEANLFTVEAFVEYLEHLTDDGVFYVYRHGGNELLRLISIAREAFLRLGVEDFAPHIYIAKNDTNRGLIMLKRRPFERDELERLDATSDELDLEILYTPSGRDAGLPKNPLFDELERSRAAGELSMGEVVELYHRYRDDSEYKSLEQTYLESDDPEQLAAGYVVDIRATTDSRPYFFFYGLRSLSDFPFYLELESLEILGGVVVLLFWMLGLFTVLVAGLIALPLFLGGAGRMRSGPAAAVLVYFSALGLGYMGVQISFVQRFVLFLGHPVHAVSVVLLAFLVWSGLGAISSSRVFASSRVTLPRALSLLFLTLIVANWVLPRVFASELISLPVPAKIIISVLLIGPIAFQMGLFFPRGIRCIENSAPELIPWAWGANSAASVLGSILALMIAIHGGFALTALLSGAVYVLFALPAGARLIRHQD